MGQFPPFAHPLNLPYDFPGMPKGIPTSGGFNPNAKGPALSVPVHEPALGSVTPAQTVQLPMSAAPAVSNTNTAASAPIDPYTQSLQNAIKADQALVDHPYQQPQYHAPAKGLEYLAAGLSLLFPGAPISYAASGLAQGLYQRSQEQYTRAEQGEQQRVAGLERTASIENQIADAQAAIQQRREAVDQRHADMLSSLQEKTREFNQAFPLKVASLKARVNYWNGELANMAARNTITQEDAQLQASTRYQVAVMQQAGLDRRNMNNNRLRSVIAQAQSATTQTDQQLKALDTAVTASGGDPATVAKAQAQASKLIAANQQHVASLLNEASAVDPSLGSAGTLQSIGTPTQQNPYGWPQAQTTAQPPITINVNPNGAATSSTVLPGENTSLQGAPTQGEAFPGHPSLGNASGVDPKIASHYTDVITQNASHLPTRDAVLHAIATTPALSGASSEQINAMLQAWQKTQAAHAQQHANPQAATTKGATQQAAPAPVMNGLAGDSGHPVQTPGWLTNIVHGVENTLNKWNQPIVQPAAAAEQKPRTILEAITTTANNTKGLGAAGVPLLRALVAAESGDTLNAQSGVGAIGLTQLMPDTAKSLGIDPNDPMQNLKGGAEYLAQMLNKFHSIPLALAAYNAGPGAVEKYHGIPPYPETQAYVKRVLSIYSSLVPRR